MRATVPRKIFTMPLLAGGLIGAVLFFNGMIVSVGAEFEVKLNSKGFVVHIEGLPLASQNIVGVSVEDLVVDVRDVTEDDGTDWSGFRRYAPGDAHYGRVTLRVRTGPGSQELRQWFQEAAVGKSIRRNISLIIKDRSGQEGRRYDLMESFPVKYDPGDYSPSSTTRVETIVVKIGFVEFAAAPTSDVRSRVASFGPIAKAYAAAKRPDEKKITKGFRVEVSGPSGGTTEDTAWETTTGGALEIEVAPASVGSDQTNAVTPGHKFVEELRLRGPVTASRKWLSDAVNNASSDQQRFNVTIVEILPGGQEGRRHTYEKCFLTRYVYPVLSADGTGTLYEEVTLKPERLELQ